MTNFAARIAGVATLALAVVPVAALTTAAHASTAGRTIVVADLDLTTPAGMDAFEARLHDATRRICRGETALATQAACVKGVQAEAMAKLAQYMAQSRSAPTALAAR